MAKVIVGLGNPGRRYSRTRHNMGFMVIDKLAYKYDIELNKKRFDALWGEGRIEGERVFIVKPQTFMNLSGNAVRSILNVQNAEPSDLLILYDDMDLKLGKIRLRPEGSAGGHKGLKSIIENIGTNYFTRIRIGIGKPENGELAEDYVLSPFNKSEAPEVADVIAAAMDAVVMAIKDGITATMNKYNSRNSKQ